MCDFRPGDEVEKFREHEGLPGLLKSPFSLPVGTRAVVEAIGVNPHYGHIGLHLSGYPDNGYGHYAAFWRKVQRRSLTAWLSTSTTFEEPRRAPAKKRERA